MCAQLFERAPRSFNDELWRSASSLVRQSVFSLAEVHSSEAYFAFQVLLRHCDVSPLSLVEKYSTHFDGIEVRWSDALSGAGVVRLRSRDGALSTCLACVPSSLPGIWLLGTSAKARTPEYDRLIGPLLDRFSSRLNAGWLSSRELENSLVAFQQTLKGRIAPSRVASRGFDRSTIEYLKAASLDQVITELRDSQLLMQSMEFKLHPLDSKRVMLSGAVNRSFRLVYRVGSSVLMDQYLVSEFEQLLASHFGHVAIHEHEWGERRIVYRFEQDALMSRESHTRLVDSLAAESKLSVCAFHLNPYLNLSVTDLTDGSSMTLVSDVPDEMYVMPGRRCTPGAVSRVLDSVYAQFAAGRVGRDETLTNEWSSDKEPV